MAVDVERGPKGQVWAVLGPQWGDEGKGKLVDLLASSADICARFNGGSNAGHTLVVDGQKFAMHLAPCGVLYPETENFLGNGTVIHLKTLEQELDSIKSHIPDVWSRVVISSRAHLLFDLHQAVDSLQEREKAAKSKAVGTTKKGIGPCYSTKVGRIGIRAGDLLRWESFEIKLRELYAEFLARYPSLKELYNVEDDVEQHRRYATMFGPMIRDGVTYIHKAIANGKKILVEGANAAMLDVDFGTYPFVTSSTTTVAGVCGGLGLPVQSVKMVIAVVKAYTSRVGEGPFPTELFDETGEYLRKRGVEFGTTTGRPRRCGWLDVHLLRYSVAINGFTAINVSKLDVLTGLKELKICTTYKHKVTGKCLEPLLLPTCAEEYADYEPVYEVLKGWEEDLSNAKSFSELPKNAQDYVLRMEQLINVPIVWVGIGPDRLHTIYREHSTLSPIIKNWEAEERHTLKPGHSVGDEAFQ